MARERYASTGREHSREQLADRLWPEADAAKGRASLRRTLSVTAAATGDGLVISRSAVALNPAGVQVDVREFSALLGRPDTASLERAAGHARRWLQLDPLHEPAHQAIIRLHGWAAGEPGSEEAGCWPRPAAAPRR